MLKKDLKNSFVFKYESAPNIVQEPGSHNVFLYSYEAIAFKDHEFNCKITVEMEISHLHNQLCNQGQTVLRIPCVFVIKIKELNR